MTQTEFIKFIAGITYKPDRIIKISPFENQNGCAISLHMDVENSKLPGENINLLFSKSFTYFEIKSWDEEMLKMIIYSFVQEAERHECEEWLRFNGKQYRDPHHGDRI